jgi:hypothetical protein
MVQQLREPCRASREPGAWSLEEEIICFGAKEGAQLRAKLTLCT